MKQETNLSSRLQTLRPDHSLARSSGPWFGVIQTQELAQPGRGLAVSLQLILSLCMSLCPRRKHLVNSPTLGCLALRVLFLKTPGSGPGTPDLGITWATY